MLSPTATSSGSSDSPDAALDDDVTRDLGQGDERGEALRAAVLEDPALEYRAGEPTFAPPRDGAFASDAHRSEAPTEPDPNAEASAERGESPATDDASDVDDLDEHSSDTMRRERELPAEFSPVRGPLPPPMLPPRKHRPAEATLADEKEAEREDAEDGEQTADLPPRHAAEVDRASDFAASHDGADEREGERRSMNAVQAPFVLTAADDNPTRYAPFVAAPMHQAATPYPHGQEPRGKGRVPGQRVALIAMATLLVAAVVFFAIRPRAHHVGAQTAAPATAPALLEDPPTAPTVEAPAAVAPPVASAPFHPAVAAPIAHPSTAATTPRAEPRRRATARPISRPTPIPVRREQ